jgi:DivIVA domain-containing protein
VIWLVLLVAAVLAALTVAVVLGRVDGAMGEATTTHSHVPLPDAALTPDDLDAVRFDTAMRGYRMSQVDEVVDRLRREICELDGELRSVRAGDAPLEVVPPRPAPPEPEPGPEPEPEHGPGPGPEPGPR